MVKLVPLPLQVLTECDPIQLAIFSHRFMSIAEQMGRALQRTSISVNIKERLDFSCALFGAPLLPAELACLPSCPLQASMAFCLSDLGAFLLGLLPIVSPFEFKPA